MAPADTSAVIGDMESDAAWLVVRPYGRLIQSIDGYGFYDTSMLDAAKDEVLRALLSALRHNSDPVVEFALEGSVEILTRFRDGIGPEPILPAKDGADPKQLSKLNRAALKDVDDYKALVQQAKDTRLVRLLVDGE
ncbi:MAG: hypothetical protein QF654_09435 [Alphaproteobacteria bacterium]|jgi:hypothetical protein|nr:hypothetical protein [Alphaproteobacteria bacterium]